MTSKAGLGEQAVGALVFGQGMRVGVLRYLIGEDPTGSEQDTSLDLPTEGIVLGCWVKVNTAESTGTTKTLDVGLLSSESGGDADGFLDGIDVSSTGIKQGTLDNGGQTLGALLRVDESGAGNLVREPHVLNGTAKSVTYTAGSNDFAELRAYIYVLYAEFV